MPVVQYENSVIMGNAAALLEANSPVILQIAHDRLGIAFVGIEKVRHLAKQWCEIDFLVLAEMLFDDFEGSDERGILDGPVFPICPGRSIQIKLPLRVYIAPARSRAEQVTCREEELWVEMGFVPHGSRFLRAHDQHAPPIALEDLDEGQVRTPPGQQNERRDVRSMVQQVHRVDAELKLDRRGI